LKSKRERIRQKLLKRIGLWDQKISELELIRETIEEEYLEKYDDALVDIKTKQIELRQKLSQAQVMDNSVWKVLKTDLRMALSDLKKSITVADKIYRRNK
jgi:hypothetical protein